MAKFSLENIDADECTTRSTGNGLRVDLTGVDPADIVSQMDMTMLREVIRAAGEELCIEVHGIAVAERD